MKKLLSSIFLIVLVFSYVYGGDNYTEMSTQELISIIGYVKDSDMKKFKEELESRKEKMTASEKENYKKNKDKLK